MFCLHLTVLNISGIRRFEQNRSAEVKQIFGGALFFA